MGNRSDPTKRIERLEEQLGILLENALELATAYPPQARRKRLKRLVRIRRTAAKAIVIADRAIAFLQI